VSTSIGHYVLCELLRYRALPTVSSAMCFTVDDHTARWKNTNYQRSSATSIWRWQMHVVRATWVAFYTQSVQLQRIWFPRCV